MNNTAAARATPTSGRSGDVLDTRAVNRAMLERQMLLRRSDRPVLETISHLIGMQAQAPTPPYFGLWTRLEHVEPDDLARLLIDRSVVRIALMRGTVHLVTAEDCLTLRPLIQPIFDRGLATNPTYAAGLRGADLDAVAAAGRTLVDQRPRTGAQLRDLMPERVPGADPAALAYAVRNLLPLVQVPPRGVWGEGGQAACTTAEAWLGRPLASAPSPETMILRYLAAFGPATVRDAQTWCGLTRLGEIVERLRPRLRTFRDAHGRELFDLPDAPRPDPDVPAPVRLLGGFDNVLLSYADRSRVISDDNRRRLFTKNAVIPGTVLLDGFVSGTWTLTRRKKEAIVQVEPYARLSKRDTTAVTDECVRLLAFAAPGAETHDVRFHAAP